MVEALEQEYAMGASTVLPTEYQDEASGTIIYDDNGTVRGIKPELTFLAGMYEEYAETLEFDRPLPQYSRIGVIALPAGDESLSFYHRIENQPDLVRHQKEFGDLLWYTTALAGQFGTGLHEIVGASFDDIDDTATLYVDNNDLLRPYTESYRAMAIDAASLIVDDSDQRRRESFILDARGLLTVVSAIAQYRLNTKLGAIAQQNLEKLRKRIRRGTINSGHGDDR